MFNNPLNRKYQTGGPAPTDDERKDMEGFITWIKSNVEGFKDKSTKEIAQSISDMAKSEEGKKSVQNLYSKYQKSKKEKSKFADGGKMQSFICKHAHGGNVDCGCEGMVVRGDQGIPQVPSKVVIVPKPIKGGKRLDGITGIRSETTRGNNIVQTLSKEMPDGTTSYTELEITPDRDSTFRSWNTRYGENDNVNRYVTPTVYKQLPWYKKLSPVVNMAPQHWIEAFKNNFVESDQNGGSVKSTNLNQFAKQSLDKILEQTARYNKFKNVLGKLVPTNQNSSINSPSFPMTINDINKYIQDINKRKERINKITNYFGIWKKEQPGIPINNSGNLPMPPAAPAEYGIRMPWWSEQFIRDYWSRPEYYENLREENNSTNPRRNLLEEVNEIYAGTPDYTSDLQRHQEGGLILKGDNGLSRAAGYYQRHANEGIIRKLQNFLVARGYYDGDLNGRFDRNMYEAVRQYQRDYGLKDDGMWGEDTNEVHRVLGAGETTFNGSRSGAHPGKHTFGPNFVNQPYQRASKVSYSDINNAIARAISDPEWFMGDTEDAKNWRILFMKKNPDGSRIFDQIYDSDPEFFGQSRFNKKLPTDLAKEGYAREINTARDAAATNYVLPALSLPMLANPVAVATGIGGGLVGASIGRNVGSDMKRAVLDQNGNLVGYQGTNSAPVSSHTTLNTPSVTPDRSYEGAVAGGVTGSILGALASGIRIKPDYNFNASGLRFKLTGPTETRVKKPWWEIKPRGGGYTRTGGDPSRFAGKPAGEYENVVYANRYVSTPSERQGGQIENAQRGGRISHALNWLVSGLQDARDSRIGAVGAGPVRELYNEGRDTEASNYAQNYALANLGGALGAVGANSAIGYTAASNMVNPGSVLLGEEMTSGAAPGVMIGVSGPIMDEVDNKKKNKK